MSDRLGMPVSTLQKGAHFTRYVMSLAKAHGDWNLAAQTAKHVWHDSPAVSQNLMKAAVAPGTTTDSAWASPLVPVDNANEFIQLLRPLSILGRLSGVRNIPFLLRIPRETSSALVGWRGEGLPKAVGPMAFDSLMLAPTTSAAIVLITKELLEFSRPSAEVVVRASLLAAMRQHIDSAFVDHTQAPVGTTSPGAINYGVATFNSSGASVAAIDSDLGKLIDSLSAGSVAFESPYWLMNPKTAIAWSKLRGTGGEQAYEDLTARGGMLLGIPVLTSTSVPIETASTTAVTLIDSAQVLVADDGQAGVDMFRQGTLQAVSNPVSTAAAQISLWAQNLVAIRIERAINWTLAHPEACAVLTGVAV